MRTTTWDDLLLPGNAADFFARQSFPSFELNATGYNRGNARWLMELSRLVYRHDREEDNPPPQPARTRFLANAGYTQRKFFRSDDTDTQAMLVESTRPTPHTILVFRGTEQNSGDLATDLDIWQNFLHGLAAASSMADTNSAYVHEGFKQALNSVWDEIAAELSGLGNVPLFYTGHSLGAALATLAATRHAPKAIYTFGSPRVGNQAFARTLAGIPIYRVVDDEDIVATQPPDWLGFVHVGVTHLLKEAPEDVLLSHLSVPPKSLADHAPVNYLDRI